MTENERVRKLRKALNLTLEKFGERLGVKKNAISAIETGRNTLTEQNIKSICREFNVNEDWLRNGVGEMFKNLSEEDELAYIVGQALPHADNYVKSTFIALGRLSQTFTAEDWAVVRKFIDALSGKDN